jgi:hypothetical protein
MWHAACPGRAFTSSEPADAEGLCRQFWLFLPGMLHYHTLFALCVFYVIISFIRSTMTHKSWLLIGRLLLSAHLRTILMLRMWVSQDPPILTIVRYLPIVLYTGPILRCVSHFVKIARNLHEYEFLCVLCVDIWVFISSRFQKLVVWRLDITSLWRHTHLQVPHHATPTPTSTPK